MSKTYNTAGQLILIRLGDIERTVTDTERRAFEADLAKAIETNQILVTTLPVQIDIVQLSQKNTMKIVDSTKTEE